MFNWFKNLFGKKEPQKNVEEIPENALVKEIKSKMNLIFHSYLHYAKEIQNLDSRFFINEICNTLNFYIIHEYGQKRIAHIYEFYMRYESGVWDSAFSVYLDELISKCKELKEKEIQEQKIAKEKRENAINKLFEKDV